MLRRVGVLRIFQFQYGSIKRIAMLRRVGVLRIFQFQYGSIKSCRHC